MNGNIEFSIETLFTLLGGLALFLYGMNIMSDNLQKVAGEGMKNILNWLTKNPLLGVCAGALATAVLQSSSATTIMAIGFVSAGLMRLPQAISIIFGANIGTTITAQIIAFKISDYIFLITALGFIIYFISKAEKRKQIGLSILSFGILFLGIEIMGDVMKPFAHHEGFINLIDHVKDVPVLGLLVGCIMTIIVQSSSATIAVLQNFASQPDALGNSVIGLNDSIPILLGDNIGTTITAILASIGQTKNAKRVAIAHSIFNITGAMLFLCIIPIFADFIRYISPTGPEIEVISRQIANTHTTFNIAMTIIWTPLIFIMVKIVMFLIPDKKEDQTVIDASENASIMYLDDNILNQPMAAMVLVTKETIHTASLTTKMIEQLQEVIENKDKKLAKSITEKAEKIRNLYNKINDYLANILSRGGFNEKQAEQTACLTSIICEIDRIATLCAFVAEQTSQDQKENGVELSLSSEAREDLKSAIDNIKTIFIVTIKALKHNTPEVASEVMEKRSSIVDLDFQMRKSHLKRVKAGDCKAEMTKIYNSILHNLNRMEISCVNIADLLTSTVNFEEFLSIEQPKINKN
jgi:phosphate:Na+ symporter